MTKKFKLKPGKHQFAPGSHAVHDNNNLSDEEARWYLEKYPHIAALFVEKLKCCKVEVLVDDIPEVSEENTPENDDDKIQKFDLAQPLKQ